MQKDLTLLVLAAGMGSRFGGLKQVEPVGPNGEFIIDYSIKDAINAGFNKIVFVIKEENLETFKNTIGHRIDDKIKVEYAFQKMEDVPNGLDIPKDRVKPLGTAHAVYAARNIIHENFAMINADDFYGRDAYLKAAEFLNNCEDDEYANISFEVGKTLSLNGSVKRGVLFEENGLLKNLVESSIELVDNKIIATPLDGEDAFEITSDMPVSMNLFCFTPKIFESLGEYIKDYFLNSKNILTDEYLIQYAAFESAKENNKPIKIIPTTSKYYGMTFREDLKDLKNGINEEIEKGIYNKNLWG